jgi:transposase
MKSNLKPCPDCGRDVSKSAAKCPHCGRDLISTFNQLVMGLVFGLVGVIVVGLLLIGLFVFVPVLLH